MGKNKRNHRNGPRRERRNAKRKADHKVNCAIIRTCNRLGLYSKAMLQIMELEKALEIRGYK